MFQAQARWLLLAGLAGSSLLACSDDSTPGTPNNTAGSPSGGSAGSTAQGGSTSGSGGGSSTAGTMSSSGSGGTPTAGTGGTAAGGGGAGGGTAGGTGGASGGSGGSGGAAGKTAVAKIMGATVEGKATFTQGATMTTLVLELTKCPDGEHSSHLHEEEACGSAPFTDAGGHWANGEMLGDYTCAGGTVTKEVMRGTDKWTVGDGGPNDVTKYTFMVHAMGDPDSGDRIGCGPID